MGIIIDNLRADAMLDDFQQHVHAEDEEREMLVFYLDGAISYLKNLINRDFTKLNKDEAKTFNICVLQIATSWYLNRDGSAKGASNTFSAINPMIETLRVPGFGSNSNE